MSNGIDTICERIIRLTCNQSGLMAELQTAAKVIRQRSEIRDVVFDVACNQP